MSAIDWAPGPRLRAAMDAGKALAHMRRDELGGYGLTVRRFGARKLFAAGTTAQEAADHMEEILERIECDVLVVSKDFTVGFYEAGKADQKGFDLVTTIGWREK